MWKWFFSKKIIIKISANAAATIWAQSSKRPNNNSDRMLWTHNKMILISNCFAGKIEIILLNAIAMRSRACAHNTFGEWQGAQARVREVLGEHESRSLNAFPIWNAPNMLRQMRVVLARMHSFIYYYLTASLIYLCTFLSVIKNHFFLYNTLQWSRSTRTNNYFSHFQFFVTHFNIVLSQIRFTLNHLPFIEYQCQLRRRLWKRKNKYEKQSI